MKKVGFADFFCPQMQPNERNFDRKSERGERMDDSKIVSYPEDPADYYEQTVLPILQTVLLQDQ